MYKHIDINFEETLRINYYMSKSNYSKATWNIIYNLMKTNIFFTIISRYIRIRIHLMIILLILDRSYLI